MSNVSSWDQERRAQKQVERWGKKFPQRIAREMIRDAYTYSRSPKAKEVYASWLREHSCIDAVEEYREVMKFLDVGPGMSWALPEENLRDFKGFIPPVGDEFNIPEVEYIVRKKEDHSEA